MYKHTTTLFCLLILSLLSGTEAVAQEAGKLPETTVTTPKFGLVLTRIGQSGERSRRRFSYLQFDDPVHSKLVDGTLAQYSPAESEAVGDDEQLQWKRVEFDETGGVEERSSFDDECRFGRVGILGCAQGEEEVLQWTQAI